MYNLHNPGHEYHGYLELGEDSFMPNALLSITAQFDYLLILQLSEWIQPG